MGVYRTSRNITATLIDYLTTQINGAWSNVTVVSSFPDNTSTVVVKPVAIVCVRVSDTNYLEVEIGSELRYREPLIIIDIFATGSDQRLDLKDFIISKLISITYYEYVITNGAVSSKIPAGKIIINPSEIKDTIVNLNVDKNSLSTQDKNRHRITVKIKLNKPE